MQNKLGFIAKKMVKTVLKMKDDFKGNDQYRSWKTSWKVMELQELKRVGTLCLETEAFWYLFAGFQNFPVNQSAKTNRGIFVLV